MLACYHEGGGLTRTGVLAMRIKAIAGVVIVALSAAAFVAMRAENRADAAKGDCYAADQGPSTPTICS